MAQWVISSISLGGSTELFLFQPVLHSRYNKGHSMIPVCGIMHIKDHLWMIGKEQLMKLNIRVVLHNMSDAM